MFKNQRFGNNNNRNNNNSGIRINEQIRCTTVLVIKDDIKLGNYSPYEAVKLARESGLDLVEVAPQAKPPVCRIMDFGKFKYEQSLKDKEQKKKQKTSMVKELWLSPTIEDHDLEVKINSARKFLEEGNRVNFKLKFERRQNAHKDLGFIIVTKIIKFLEDIATPQNQPKLDGNTLNCLLDPKVKNV